VDVAAITGEQFDAGAGGAKGRKSSLPLGATVTVTFREERLRSIKIGDRTIAMGHASSWVGSAECRPRVTRLYAGESKGVWRLVCFLSGKGKNPLYLLPLADKR
jgi:hypothetical protein